MCTRPHLLFCECKTAWLAQEWLVSMDSSLHLGFLNAKQRVLNQNHKSLWVPDLTCRLVHAKLRDIASELQGSMGPALICGFWMQNRVFWTKITSLYESQTSPVVLCLQNSVISIRVTSLHGFLPSSVVFACKTASFGPELQVSMDPRPHQSFCVCKTEWLAQVPMGPSRHLWFWAFKTATLEPKLHVSKGTWPHLWFCACKTECLASEKLVSKGARPHLFFGCKTTTFGSELQVCMGPRPHLSFCACKTAWLASELLVCMGPSPHLWFLQEQRLLDQNYKSLCVLGLTCCFVNAKQRD